MSKSFLDTLSVGGAENMAEEEHDVFSELLVRDILSKGFHTSIIYGTAGLMYGKYRGLDDILRN